MDLWCIKNGNLQSDKKQVGGERITILEFPVSWRWKQACDQDHVGESRWLRTFVASLNFKGMQAFHQLNKYTGWGIKDQCI